MSHNSGTQVDPETGIYTSPNQPAFFAFLTSDILNVTGNGTEYSIVFDSKEYDQNNNFNVATGIFTAPITAKYMFYYSATIINAASANRIDTFLDTSSQRYRGNFQDLLNVLSSNAIQTPVASIGPVSMTALDTAKVTIKVNGVGGDTVDIDGYGVDMVTYFSGNLVA